jgi:phospholipase C
MQENRSFDHYFQKLPEHGQPDVAVAPAHFANPDEHGHQVPIYHERKPCVPSTPHSWAAVHQQLAQGRLDGFVMASGGAQRGGARAMGYYGASDLPFYYALAGEFAIADHYHSSVLGPTWPNRMYLYAASSYGRIRNVQFQPDATLFDELERRRVKWKVYFSDHGGLGDYLRALLPRREAHERTLDDYYRDAARGTLPQVGFVCSTFAADTVAASTWEHAPGMIQVGERFVAEVVDALGRSPNWPRSALFLTYDEHGGLYDHVGPPPACPPDDNPPQVEPDDPPGGFDQLGFRVPLIVVSPWAKTHYVGHHVYDHTSIVRFIQARHVLPALTARDANAEAPWDLFDFTAPPHPDPPVVTIPTIDAAALAACASRYDGDME